MGQNSSFLDPLLSPTHQDDGTPLPRRANINLIGFSVADNPTDDATDITNTGGTGAIAFATLAALRAASNTDGEVATVVSPIGTWVYDADTGAGQADDGLTIVIPDDVVIGSNGRWYNVNTSQVLPTIASLRLATSGQQASISVQNYATVADGGGGIFDYDASDTTSADDGGTIIVAGTRRYKRRYAVGGHVKLCWFGAGTAAQGVSDNYAALNNAIAVANTKKTLIEVQCKDAAYPITTAAACTVLKGCLGMVGVGRGRVVFNHAGTDSDVFILRGFEKIWDNIVVINRRNADYSSRCAPVHAINCAYSRFKDFECDAENNSVSDLLIEQSYDGVAITNATNASPIVITIASARTWETGDLISVGASSGSARVLGNTAANGNWTVTRVDSTHFSLNGSTGNGVYTAATGKAAYAEDANALCHLGAWYIEIVNPKLNYITAGVSPGTGYGLDMRVNANAQGVVDPPQQIAGTYTGSVSHVDVFNINTEARERGVSLSLCTHVNFYGGQFLGCATQAYGRTSQQVNFFSTYHNQWVTACFDFDIVSCRIISLFDPHFQHTGSPVSIGAIGELGTGQGMIADDVAATAGIWLRGGWYRPDRSGYGFNSTNSANTHENDTHTFQNKANNGSGDVNLFDITMNRVAGGILKVDKSGSGGSAWFTSGFYFSPNGVSIRLALADSGSPNQSIGGWQWYNDSSVLKGAFLNATGKFDYVVGIQTDLIEEHTAAAGVTIDGVLCKDNGVTGTGQLKGGSLCATGVITGPDGSTTALALTNGGPHDAFGAWRVVPSGGTEHVFNEMGVRPIVQTTDGTTSTDIANIAVPDGFTGEVELTISAKYNTGAGGAAGDRARFHRLASIEHRGATQTVDTPDAIGTDKNTPGYTLFSIDMSGGNVRVFVKGGANATVDWGVAYQLRGINP